MRGFSLRADFLNVALEEAEASLNANQDLSELGLEVDLNNSFIDSDVIKNDADALALEDRVEDLLSLLRLVKTEGGINKTMALEAERLIPGFIGGNIDYYTDDVSLTKYNVSLEEMSKSVKTIIVGIAIAIAAIVYKIVKWIFGDSTATGGSGGGSNSSNSPSTPSPSINPFTVNGKVNTTGDIKKALNDKDFAKAEEVIEQVIENVKEDKEVVKEVSNVAQELDEFIGDSRLYIHLGSGDPPRTPDGFVDRTKLYKLISLSNFADYLAMDDTDVISPAKKKAVLNILEPSELMLDFLEKGDLTKSVHQTLKQIGSFVMELDSDAKHAMELYNQITRESQGSNPLINKSLSRLEEKHMNKVRLNINGKEYRPGELETYIRSEMYRLDKIKSTKKFKYTEMMRKFHNSSDELIGGSLVEAKNLIGICKVKIAAPLEKINRYELASVENNDGDPNSADSLSKAVHSLTMILSTVRAVSTLCTILMEFIEKRQLMLSRFLHANDILFYYTFKVINKEASYINEKLANNFHASMHRLRKKTYTPMFRKRTHFTPLGN